ncbi:MULTISPECIES: FAD binding domain-containing protein [Xanthomonas]|uniref:FAD binding domain-containing protein n=1 Tax=Xanthomonas TaxID=338 RepID=UPI000CEEC1F0|nr:xanthine dehydrogenase family protein subunit M [Xanthomonas arboricola]MBB6575397.1 xanthine dehydrogenase YagS FAD-binding subunit [Xanthomonas arboricola]PPT86632.1 FAD-binding molybdopterin dehydrogenase [Xanthomonas arboricola]PPU10249.1 FAD-binding molybdopterin dehydrogenase [Xanthomonas arboricola]PPU44929.1 FAD-binding molybdopterin dehydrogenase [Xanthomonas arboricola]
MKTFDYVRTDDVSEARQQASKPATKFLAGGTTLLDLMKCGVERPARLVDISRLRGLSEINLDDRRIRIGATAKMSQVAADAQIKKKAPVLSEALWRAASPQLRNMASIGGNLLQRTRCSYFRDPAAYPACNKRSPGSGCAALDGVNRQHAVLGASEACIAIYPGDLAVALVAFDATVRIRGNTERTVLADDFYRLPGLTPQIEHDLSPGEMIIEIDVPIVPALKHSHYLKVRDRASYEFAAASAAVGIELESDGRTIRDVRIALGGVGTKPWRARAVEQALIGKTFSEPMLREAAKHSIDGAEAREHNGYKITLAPRVVARALMTAGGLA